MADVDDSTLVTTGMLQVEMKEMVTVLRTEMKDMATELRTEMKDMATELRTEMKDMATELRTEMKDMATELRAEMKDMATELRTEMKDMATELRAEMHAGFEKLILLINSQKSGVELAAPIIPTGNVVVETNSVFAHASKALLRHKGRKHMRVVIISSRLKKCV